MSNKNLMLSEMRLAERFLNYDIKDSFSVLGSHATDGGAIVRAYLDPHLPWQLVSAQSKKPLEAQFLCFKQGFHSWLHQGKSPPSYLFKGGQGEHSKYTYDPYRFGKLLSADTQHFWNEGTLFKAWEVMGANFTKHDGQDGYIFRVWAPHAARVAVIGDFNNWDPLCHGMRFIIDCGIWEIFIPGVKENLYYKYHIITADKEIKLKADPYAFQMQRPPNNASVTYHEKDPVAWQDQKWLAKRTKNQALTMPLSIFEVHLDSWRKKDGRSLSYYEMETELVDYVKELGFTHVEFMPISEYPLDASWGYQPVGLYATTIRFGTAKELKYLINAFHKAGIGVILDWVPAHFPADEHGLARFDGSYLYEYQDLRKGFHPDWQTLIFNFARIEVLNYLISNAIYWIEEYHIDGLRIDAVSSMLYLSYSRQEGEWERNVLGGAENLEAIAFLKKLTTLIHKKFPGVLLMAEESTMWQGVTKHTSKGGLGFDYKWNMGWMNDSLQYIKKNPAEKPHFHHVLTHCIDYAFTENYILPLSHDEVVHGKSPMIGKMPGFDEHKFPLLRAYYSYMWAHPGKKLLFMGNEFSQRKEWDFKNELEWRLLEYDPHRDMRSLIKRLNHLYRTESALYTSDNLDKHFIWIKKNDTNESVFAFLRCNRTGDQRVICIVNFSDRPYENQRLGVPVSGEYQVLLHSEATEFGGWIKNWQTSFTASENSWDSLYHDLNFYLPAACCIYLKVPNYSS